MTISKFIGKFHITNKLLLYFPKYNMIKCLNAIPKKFKAIIPLIISFSDLKTF